MDNQTGHIHILTQLLKESEEIFKSIGFSVAIGEESDSVKHNFDALNFPPEHPARDLQDTFYLKQNIAGDRDLLRTHTSATQIRIMQTVQPPLSYIVPGKVFRSEATDATHEVQFHQIEGLRVAEDVSMGELKSVLYMYLSKIFKRDVKLRFRPSFFPFTEPSMEVDIERERNGKKEWLELLGAGMVHPNVLRNGGIDPEKYKGYAFGLGIERIAMITYGIDDVRLFYDGDLRFVNQF